MSGQPVELKIDNKVIEQIVASKIEAEVLAGLSGAKDELIKRIVGSILSQKVNEQGERPHYASDGRYSLLEWLVQNEIKRIARESLAKFVEQFRPELEKKIQGALKQGQGQLAKALVNHLEKQVERSTINVNVTVDLKEPRY